MKYNPKACEAACALPGLADIHPLWPQLRRGGLLTQGALQILYETERLLSELTGMAEFTLQPLAGAHGELTGVMIIAAYHRDRGNKKTHIIIPDSAHGTNPASAAIARLRRRDRPVRQARQHGHRRAEEGAELGDRRRDDDLPVHARPVRLQHPRDRRRGPRGRRPDVLRRREPERDPRPLQAGRHGVRRLPPQPAQDVRHAARRRRARRGPGRRGGEAAAVPADLARREDAGRHVLARTTTSRRASATSRRSTATSASSSAPTPTC